MDFSTPIFLGTCQLRIELNLTVKYKLYLVIHPSPTHARIKIFIICEIAFFFKLVFACQKCLDDESALPPPYNVRFCIKFSLHGFKEVAWSTN